MQSSTENNLKSFKFKKEKKRKYSELGLESVGSSVGSESLVLNGSGSDGLSSIVSKGSGKSPKLVYSVKYRG